MITLIVWDHYGYKVGEYENLTLKELGEKLCALSKDWILVFDTVHDYDERIGFTMEVTKATKRDNIPEINEHMDADMERGIEH